MFGVLTAGYPSCPSLRQVREANSAFLAAAKVLSYTPAPGFAGTEQFIYSVQDTRGSISNATVTVNSLPGARNDDLVDFSIGIFDVVNDQPISSVQVGDSFNVRVFVDELNNPSFSPQGVASGFLDLVYSKGLVATQNSLGSPLGFGHSIRPNLPRWIPTRERRCSGAH